MTNARPVDRTSMDERRVKKDDSDAWRVVWRNGFMPQLSDDALQRLRKALQEDDPRLLQGATCSPPPLQSVQNWTVDAACLVAFGASNDGDCVAVVEGAFARACHECDRLMNEPASCRFFLNWWDETPRQDAIKLMIDEIDDGLRRRRHERAIMND